MRSLFATILALSASTSALPAIANSTGATSSFNQGSNSYLSAIPVQSKANLNSSISNDFAQRSLNITKQIPADAIGLLIVDLSGREWEVLKQFQEPALRATLGIDKLFATFKDFQPWLGKEVAIAFLSKPANKDELVFAALTQISNDSQFDAFVKKIEGLDTLTSTKTTYQNVKILEWEVKDQPSDSKTDAAQKLDTSEAMAPLPSSKKTKNHESDEVKPTNLGFPDFSFKKMAIAKLPSGIAVIASNRQAIENMINLSNPDLQLTSLADNPLFLRSLNNPLWNRSVIAGYGDFKGIGQYTEALAADLPETSEIPGFSRAEYIQSLKYTLAEYSSFDFFTWATAKGLRSQSSSYFSEVRSPLRKDTEPRDRLLSFLPTEVYGAITSRNLNRQWQWFVKESKVQPTYKIFVEGLRMLSPLILGAGLDIDIEKDIISWVDGEYAFVAFPSDRSPLKEMGTNLTMGMLIRTSKPEIANATLQKLTKYFTNISQGVLQVKKRQVGATLLTSFEFPDFKEEGKTQSAFAYGWRDRQTLMLTLGSDTASAFVPIPKPSLTESVMFRDAIAEMPQPNFGYFYLNANAIAKLGAKFYLFEILPSSEEMNKPSKTNLDLSQNIQKAVDKLSGLVFVYSETSDRFQSDFFLGLNP